MIVGRLEGDIVVPAGGWEFDVADAGSSGTVTIPAGSYTPTEFAEFIDTALLGIGSEWQCSISNGETGTGRSTISSSDIPFSVTWTDTEPRDALGFTANIVGVSVAQTSSKHAKGLWLPGDSSLFLPYGRGAGGSIVTDYVASTGPTGRVHAMIDNTFRRHDRIRWSGVPKHRALDHFEVIDGESWESWFQDVATGRLSYIPVNTNIRYTWNCDQAGSYVEGKLLWPPTFDVDMFVRGWAGRWMVSLPPLLVES